MILIDRRATISVAYSEMNGETSQVFVWASFILDTVLICAVVGLAIAWKVSLLTVTRSAEFRESIAAAVEVKIHGLVARCEQLENSWADWHEKHQRVANRIAKIEEKAEKTRRDEGLGDGLEIAGPPVELSAITGGKSTGDSEAQRTERDAARRKLTAQIVLGKKFG